LSFAVDAGTGSAPVSLSWRDQQGNSFAISFASDMSSFFGYFQRSNEGPIAYRGTRK
jgi:OAA-family lectin sugar binding domain